MHFPFWLLAALLIIGVAVVGTGFWLSVKIFRLKLDKASLGKIVGAEVLLAGAAALLSIGMDNELGASLSLVAFVGGIGVWIVLLKRYAATQYKLGRAVGSYITGYVLATALSLVVALMFIAFFAQVYQIEGESMKPALSADERVLIYKFDRQPSNNEIITYKTKTGAKVLGRVHGIPGQSVSITSGRVEVAGKLENTPTYTLRDSQYYVTADNAAYNIPARVINADDIVGTVGPKL